MKKKKKRRKEAKNANSIGAMFDRNFTLFRERRVRFTHGSYSRVSVCRAGTGSFLEWSVPAKRGKFKRAKKPRRQGTYLTVLPNAFDIDFTWALPLSFPMFSEAQVRRASVTSRRQPGAFFNDWRAASLEKSTRVLQLLPGVKL